MDKIPLPSRMNLISGKGSNPYNYWDKSDGIPHRVYAKMVNRYTAESVREKLDPQIAMFTWLWDVRDSIEQEIHDQGIVEWPGA
jgi:hypothetical protein